MQAEELGLAKEKALALTAQTAVGAGEMILKTSKTPEELIAQVATPKGTTVEGLKVLKKAEGIVLRTIKAASKRASEIRREFESNGK